MTRVNYRSHGYFIPFFLAVFLSLVIFPDWMNSQRTQMAALASNHAPLSALCIQLQAINDTSNQSAPANKTADIAADGFSIPINKTKRHHHHKSESPSFSFAAPSLAGFYLDPTTRLSLRQQYRTYGPRHGDVNYDIQRSTAAMEGDTLPPTIGAVEVNAPSPSYQETVDLIPSREQIYPINSENQNGVISAGSQDNQLPPQNDGVIESDYEGGQYPLDSLQQKSGHRVNTMLNELLEDLAHRTRQNVENQMPSHRAYRKYVWGGRRLERHVHG